MRTIINASALAVAIALPMAADAATTNKPGAEDLQSQISALLQRVEQLEARNSQLEQSVQQQAVVAGQAPVAERLEAIEVKSAALEKRVASAEETNDLQSDNLAKDLGASWARSIKLKGDMRYRHEYIDREAANQRNRQRIRVRLGMDAKVNDTVSAGFQLATGQDDPRSSNQTLGDVAPNVRREFRLDQAYVTWKPAAVTGTSVTFGKMPQPYFRPGTSMMYDGDINPEGVALRWAGTSFFANAWGFWLKENSALADSSAMGLQAGGKFALGSVSTLTAAASYWKYNHVENFVPAPIFGNNANGNTTAGASATSNLRLASDFSIWQLGMQFDTRIGSLPLMVFADYLKNDDALRNVTLGDKLDTAWSVGMMLGKASAPRTWEVGVMYQDNDKDSQYGQFIDSDFGDGNTDAKGLVFRAGYAVAKNWTLNATYLDNKLRKDVNSATSPELDYQRLQVDLNFKF
jgi:hypothetical protein